MEVFIVQVKISCQIYYLVDFQFTVSKNIQDSMLFFNETNAERAAAMFERFLEESQSDINISCYTQKEKLELFVKESLLLETLA